MVVLGVDAHKRTHTVVAVDEAGRQLGVRVTASASTAAHLELVRWAGRFGSGRTWAVEDCRHLSRRLEADLLAAGEQIVRVPPKLMAHARDAARLAGLDGMVARIAADLTGRIIALSAEADALEKEITARVRVLAPSLLALPGVAALTAAKILGQTAGVDRFESKDAYARHNGTAPLPAWSGNQVGHRLARTGNRQLNCAIHRIAITQKRCHPDAQAYLSNRTAPGDTSTEALRALKRRIADAVYRRLKADAAGTTTPPPHQAA
jgi:transposase